MSEKPENPNDPTVPRFSGPKRNPKAKKDLYGLSFPVVMDPIAIEMWMIQKGGQWKGKQGQTLGMGNFFHYKRLQQLLWPKDVHHRWTDLMLEEILKNTITAIMGPKDSGKTHVALTRYALTDYFCFPQTTLIMISSTDVRGLELRVWGDMKTMFNQAKARYPSLPGHLIDSKHAISTDNLIEDGTRDLRKGVIAIPCLSSGGTWQGLGKYVGIKQKRRRLLGDECFPAGTLVDTPSGPRRIETLKIGELVLSAAGINRIRGTMHRPAKELVKITALDGRTVVCTPNHPFLTQKGWIKACELNQSHYMLGVNETMQVLRETTQEPSFLQCELQREMDHYHTGRTGQILHQGERRQNQQSILSASRRKPTLGRRIQAAVHRQSIHEGPKESKETQQQAEGYGMETTDSWRKRNWTNGSREVVATTFFKGQKQLPRQNIREGGKWVPNPLQSRHRFPTGSTGSRSGRQFTQCLGKAGSGCEEDRILNGSWVDRNEIYKQEDYRRHGECSSGIEVYNLEIEGHPSYGVQGFVAHNCQVMKAGYLDALANLNSGDQEGNEFKGVFVGNPLGIGDPLDRIAEPKNGWGTEGEITKTTVWDNRFENGRTVNLVGTDSPNEDYPKDQPTKYPWMINSKSIESVAAFYGRDSLQFWSQCKGVRKAGLNGRRIFTRNIAIKFKAFEEVAWKDDRQTKIYAVDAAYGEVGGDRCVGGWGSFGLDANGDLIIHMMPHVIIPVKAGTDTEPEDQIVMFVREACIEAGIPANHVFYDATGRGSLGTAFSRIWSPFVNPLEFGGKPTSRPVSTELQIYDESERKMRPKRCDEHFSKFVTELWFMTRYAMEAGQFRGLTEDVLEDGMTREWTMVAGNKIEIEPKIKTKERMGRSPDLMDWLATLIEGARQKGFQLRALAAPQKQGNDDWKDTLRKKAMDLHHAGALNYSA